MPSMSFLNAHSKSLQRQYLPTSSNDSQGFLQDVFDPQNLATSGNIWQQSNHFMSPNVTSTIMESLESVDLSLVTSCHILSHLVTSCHILLPRDCTISGTIGLSGLSGLSACEFLMPSSHVCEYDVMPGVPAKSQSEKGQRMSAYNRPD